MTTPFKINLSSKDIADLQQRLNNTRWPDQLDQPANNKWEYGSELNYMKELAKYWETTFLSNWKNKHEVHFNSLSQFKTNVEGHGTIHFIHEKATKSSNAPTLLLSHGWPGSVCEFLNVIPAPRENFNIVAPSLPGFGFSEPFHKRGGSYVEIARVFHKLMLQLGYTQYVAQGGDYGSMITQSLARLFPEHCVAIHLNMQTPGKFNGDASKLPHQDKILRSLVTFRKYGTGYQAIQGTRPQTLSYGLNDSPIGVCAWIVEKFRDWSDTKGDIESVYSKDDLLMNVMIYWISNSIGSSVRLYYESSIVGSNGEGMPGVSTEVGELRQKYITVPTGIIQAEYEIVYIPEAWSKQYYNVKRYTAFDVGGHFFAMEQPKKYVQEVSTFFLDDLNLRNSGLNLKSKL